jgi:hypothetical protein
MTWRDRNTEYRRKHNMMQTNIKREYVATRRRILHSLQTSCHTKETCVLADSDQSA